MSKAISMLLMIIVLSGCAVSGAKFSSVESGFPQLKADKGRLFFYREDIGFGLAMRQEILIDSVVVGRSIPGGAFYYDVSIGDHIITIPAQFYPGESSFKIQVQSGQVKYIRTSIGPGGFIGRTSIDETSAEEARRIIDEMAYTGDNK